MTVQRRLSLQREAEGAAFFMRYVLLPEADGIRRSSKEPAVFLCVTLV